MEVQEECKSEIRIELIKVCHNITQLVVTLMMTMIKLGTLMKPSQ